MDRLEIGDIEILIDKAFIKGIEFDKLNSLDLRSDIENNNIYGCILKSQGYVGNRPNDCNDENHEDDTWAIDVLTEDGDCVTSYLYVSHYEYTQDILLLKEFD